MRCCISECKSYFKHGVRSHCIPQTPELRKKWLEATKLINPGPNDRICSKHFSTNDYQEGRLSLHHYVRLSLHPKAVPSQNLPKHETNRGYNQELTNHIKRISENDILSATDGGYQLQFDDDICEDERRFYLKLFPLVNLVREKKTHCTSCNIHLGTSPANEDNVKMHPILRVTQCKKCHDFYNSGEFSKGEDGSELYCRWCGQGGEVYCCAKCPYVFCKACIGSNLSKSLVADIRDNENWSCFVCSPKITWPIRAVHWALKNYIVKQKESILLTNTTETEIRRLMKKDTSTCCRSKTTAEGESSNDSDIPLKKTYSTAPILKKRKRSNEEILGQPKPKILNSILSGSGNNNSGINLNNTNSINSTTIPRTIGVPIAPKNQTVLLNSGLVIQKHPTSASTSNSGSNLLLRPIQQNQTQVKIVQLTNQQNKTVNVPLNLPTHGSIPTSSAPPPLLIRNRGVQIRQHLVSGNVQNQNRAIHNRSTTASTATSTASSSSSSSNNEQTPVYHTIGGFCIDLNSAAQHDSIRLPNGKLIQVKKSSNNTNQTTGTTISQRNQIPSGTLHQQPTQPQQHFTITQPIHQQQQQQNNNSGGNIQTINASSLIPNATGSLQILNGNVIQQIQNQQQQQHQTIRPGSSGPMLIRNNFPNTKIGKARNQLQNQIFTAMEICQHLSGKIQTLTNSNPYKNANNHIDVKELYIHLSYLFTYAIGRFKNLQDKCNEDMTSMGFNTDVSKLTKGQLAAEKYASDGDEEEIEIVEPKTTTINLDSDEEDSIQTNNKNPNNDTTKLATINTTQLKELRRQQLAKHHQMLRDKHNEQTFKLQQYQEQQKNNMPQSEDNDYDLPLTLLAGMLEVELTEGNDSLNSTSSGSTTLLPKKPRKKTTFKPNPYFQKIRQEQLHAKYDKIKQFDLKLKQVCAIVIDPLDLDIDNVKQAFQRYSEQQNDNDDINDYEIMNAIHNNDDDLLNSSGNLDDNTVEVMQLLEVTMDGGDELNSSKTDDEINKCNEQIDEITIDKNQSKTMDENEKNIENEEKMETEDIIMSEVVNNENNSEKSITDQNNANEEEEAKNGIDIQKEMEELKTKENDKDDQKEMEEITENYTDNEKEIELKTKENAKDNQEEMEETTENDIDNEKEIELKTKENDKDNQEETAENDTDNEKEELKTKENDKDNQIEKEEIETDNEKEKEELQTTSSDVDKDSNCENILDNKKVNDEDEKEINDTEIGETEIVEKEINETEIGNTEKTNTNSEDSVKVSKDNLENQHNNLDTKEILEEIKLDKEISFNEIEMVKNDDNMANIDNVSSTFHESNISNERTLENCNSIYNEEYYRKSNVELKEILDDSISNADNINIADDIMSPEQNLHVDNGKNTPTNIDSTDFPVESSLKSNIENEFNINKSIDNNDTIEPMDIDTNLLNIQNPSELIDELLADVVKTKSSEDDNCPNDFLDQQFNESVATSE